MNRKTTSLIAAAALAGLGSLARAQVTADGILSPGEYPSTYALQNSRTGFGDNESELDAAYGDYNVGTGDLNLMITGNVAGNSNGFVLFLDNRSGGAIANVAGGGFNRFGSVSGRYTDDWGIDQDGGAGTTDPPTLGSVVNAGFNPNYALEFEHYAVNNQYYIHVIDLTLQNSPPNFDGINPAGPQANRDRFLGLGVPGGGETTSTYTRFNATDVWETPSVPSGTVKHGFNNSNTAGVNGNGALTLGDPTTATTGVEYLFDGTFMNHEPGKAIRLLGFITNDQGNYLSNQFLKGARYEEMGNLEGPGGWGGDPLADASTEAFNGDVFFTVFEPAFTAGGDNKWSTAANWAGNFAPSGVEHDAAFRNNTGVVDLDQDVTLGTLALQHDAGPAGYHIQTTSGKTITMNAGSGAARIDVPSGSHAISADVTFTSPTRFQGGLSDLTFFNTVNNPGVRITVAGGSYIFNGQNNSANASMAIDSGNVTFNADAGPNMTVFTSGNLTMKSPQNLQKLQTNTGGTATMADRATVGPSLRTLWTKELVVNTGSKLDLNDNDLVVEYGTNASPFMDIMGDINTPGKIINGFLGSDDGTIISTTGRAATNTIHYSIDNGQGIGLTEWPIGSGHAIDTNSVISKYTFLGDVNLDGKVDDGDYGIVDAGYGSTGLSADIAVLLGDANLDLNVDDGDYGTVDAAYGSGVGNPLSPASIGGGQAVPEPASFAVIAVAGSALALRRRRRRA